MVINLVKRVFFILLVLFCANMLCEGLRQSASAQEQRMMHKPYIDNRRLHWGFYLGMNMQTAKFENTGYIDPDQCTECGTCADACPSGAISL